MKILSKNYTASSGTIFNTKGNEKYNVRGKSFILTPKRHLFVKDKQFVKDKLELLRLKHLFTTNSFRMAN